MVESKASPEAQKAAEAIGWVGPAGWKGEEAEFVDADEYLEKGKIVLPILRKQNKQLHEQVAALSANAQSTAQALKEAQEAIADMEAKHTVATQRAVDDAKRSVKAALIAAKTAGDHEAEVELQEQLTELNTAKVEDPAKPDEAARLTEAEARRVQARVAAEAREWQARPENAWYDTDEEKTTYALGVMNRLRAKGDTSVGMTFFEKVSAAVEKHFEEPPRGDDKVEGSRGGATGASRQNGKKGFDALPAEARAACTADTRKFVGEGKRFAKAADWHDYYAREYFRQEERA